MFCRTESSLTVSAVEALPNSFVYVYECSSRNLSCWCMFSCLMSSQHCKVVIKCGIYVFIVALFGYTQLCTNNLLIKQKFYFHTWFNCKKCYFCIVNIAVTVYELYLHKRILCLVLYVLCYLCLYTC
jgi:hypothetical protein